MQAALRILLLAAIVAAAAAGASAQSATTWRLSLDPAGGQANKASSAADASADGRFVVFDSHADNLIGGDTNGTQSVYLLDRATGRIEMLSAEPDGGPGDGYSAGGRISADGRTAAFSSYAKNLVPGDTNGHSDIFLRDLKTGRTRRISLGPGGVEGDGSSRNPAISADGQRVVFESDAPNLVPGDSNGVSDIFLYDRAADRLARVSIDSAGLQAEGHSQQPSISGDGRVVAFSSLAANLDPGDDNGTWDVYVHDLVSGATTLASRASTGQMGDWWSNWPELAGDGRRVVFQSLSALVPSDTNEDVDVYLFDLAVGSLELVSVAQGGGPGNAASAHPTISAAGDLVAFDSAATDLIAGDTNGQRDAFLRDLTLGTTERVSLSTAGTQVADGSVNVVVSPSGERVLFRSWASDLVPNDTNAVDDIFVRELAGCSATVATYCAPSTPSVPGCTATLGSTGAPSLSAPAAFHVRALRVPGAVRGLAYLGARGPAGTPFGTQGGRLCVAPPAWRSAPKGSGGSIGACDGQLVYTLQELVSASGGRIVAGDTVHVALWFRDPAAPDGFGLSDGLWFQVCP